MFLPLFLRLAMGKQKLIINFISYCFENETILYISLAKSNIDQFKINMETFYLQELFGSIYCIYPCFLFNEMAFPQKHNDLVSNLKPNQPEENCKEKPDQSIKEQSSPSNQCSENSNQESYQQQKRSYKKRKVIYKKNYLCSKDGCNKSYSSNIARRNHQRLKHEQIIRRNLQG